jgi:outer membrane receptor protein involved in Fe transport
MRRSIFLLLVFAGVLPAVMTAQSVVRGVVSDAGTRDPIPGVHIIWGSGQGSLSGSEGDFLVRPGTGDVSITFRYVGYRAERREFVLNEGDTVSLEIALVPDITTLNEIVVSAGRAEQRLSELTVSMTVIKPYIVNRSHIANAEELLNRTPGIEILDGQASVRGGSGYSYGAGSRVMALVDGLPALSADAGNIKWNTLPLENISRIEVIKGASSVLYGSSALNGIINFITREAADEPLTQVMVSSGIYDNPPRSDWKWWSTARMTSSASLSHSKLYGGTGVGLGLKLFTENGYRKLNDERYARVNLRLRHHDPRSESLAYGLNIGATMTSKSDFLLWEDADYGALKQNQATAMEFRGTSLNLDPFVSFERGRSEHNLKARLMTNINRLPGNANNNSNSHSVYSEYQYSSGRRGVFSVVAGLMQQYIVIGSNFYGDHTGLNLAGYSQFEAEPLTWLRAVAGLRIEKYILDGDGEKPVPIVRAGLNATLAPATFLRASIGQGYRYPAVAEKFAYTTLGSIRILPNSEIKPESGWSSELGIKHGFSILSLSGQADLALFYSQNTDMIEFVFGYWYDTRAEMFTYGFQPTNIENSRVYGAEAELTLNLTSGRLNTLLTAGYTFMYPVEVNGVTGRSTGDYLKFRRKNSADISLSSSAGRFEAGINITIKSRILEIDDVFLNEFTREDILPGFYDYWLENNKGHFVLDLFSGYRFGKGYQASAGIKNLTNTEYMGRPGDIMPHRYYSIQLMRTF